MRRGGTWADGGTEGDRRRLFIAVPLPAATRDAVVALIERVPAPAEGRPVRWVRTDGLHLTLRFLGPTEEELVSRLVHVVESVAANTPPFEAGLGEAGAFPSHARPRALWLGVDDATGALGRLAGRVNDALAMAGWPPETRPFRPHLTLARSDGVRAGPAAVRSLVEAATGFSERFLVDRLVLFESHTGGGPARYVPLHEAALAG